MTYTLDFIRLEFKNFTRNIFLWIAQLVACYTINSEAIRFLGKKGYLLSDLVQSGRIAINQEMMAMAVIFTLSNILLFTVFAFGNYFRAFIDDRHSEIVLKQIDKDIKTDVL